MNVKMPSEIMRMLVVLILVAVWPNALLAGEVSGKSSNSVDSKVILFSQPFCPGCEAAKEYLHRHQIPYLNFDISSSRAARSTFERLGGRGTPLFLIGGQRIHGFSVPRLEQRLMELGISGDES
jgi:glutaredoxin